MNLHDTSLLVPAEALCNIKCDVCKNYLSYFPIYIDQNSQLPICGRCSKTLETSRDYIHNKPLETIIQFLKFPCMYDSLGCIKQLTPADVPKHEMTCCHKIIDCPLSCTWEGLVKELLRHVQKMHPNTLLKNHEFEMDTINSYPTHYFLVHNNEIFALKCNLNETDNILQYSIFCYKTTSVTNYRYEMTVFNESKNLSLKFPVKSAENLQEKDITQIEIDKVRKKLGDPSAIITYVRIFILDEQEEIEEPKKPNLPTNRKILEELQCPICLDYIIPPIYQCVAGHCLCGDCKSQIKICPLCKGEITDKPNFTLEKIALLLVYPCKYLELGCDFASRPAKIVEHQKICSFAQQFCPLKDYTKCEWKDITKNVGSHLTACHSDHFLKIDNLCIHFNEYYSQSEDNHCFVKEFSDALFKIHYRYSQHCFYWAVQLIGQPEEASNYRFEIDIQDSSNNNQRMLIRSVCAPLKDKGETFVDPNQYVFLQQEQIDSFIADEFVHAVRIRN